MEAEEAGVVEVSDLELAPLGVDAVDNAVAARGEEELAGPGADVEGTPAAEGAP